MSFLQPLPKEIGCLLWSAIIAIPVSIFAAGFMIGRYL